MTLGPFVIRIRFEKIEAAAAHAERALSLELEYSYALRRDHPSLVLAHKTLKEALDS